MNLYALQFDVAWEQPAVNHRRVRELLAHAPLRGPGLLALPEMFATGFTMNSAVTLAAAPATRTFLAELARDLGLYVVAGLVGSGTVRPARNLALAFGPGGQELAAYAKQRLFRPGGEEPHHEPGTQPVTFTAGDWQVAPLICYDLRFPELFRQVASHVHLYVVIANWPAPRAAHWRTLLQARAIENQAYVLGVNRCGRDPQHEFAGGSLIVGPQGEVVAEAGAAEGLLAAPADLAGLLAWRRQFPALEFLCPPDG